MRILFCSIFVILVIWGAFMVPTSSDKVVAGKTALVWATDDTPIRRKQIELFNKMNPDLLLKIDPSNNDPNKVIVQSIGGVGPDVFDIPGTTLRIFVGAEIALDITKELKNIGYDSSKEIWPAAATLYQYEGRVYGIPANLDALGIYYNKKAFDDAGVNYPRENATWDEVVEIGKKLTLRNTDGTIRRYGLLFWWDWRDFFAMFGAKIFSEDGSTITINSPEAKQAVTLMHDLVFKHHLAPSQSEMNAMATTGGWGSGNESRFVGGRAAMVLGPRYFTANFRQANLSSVGVANLPLGVGGHTRVRGRTIAINALSPNRKAALRFLKYVMGPEYNNLNNALADGVGPTMKYTESENFKFDPAFPQEKYNLAWRKAMLAAEPDQSSVFITNNQIDEAVGFQMDLVSQGQKTPEAALRDAEIAANRLLQQNLDSNAALAKRYSQLKGAR